MSTIHAVYENGVFRPKEPVDLPESSQVQLEIVHPMAENLELQLALDRIQHRTTSQIELARERILKASRPARPLPEGMTLSDMVEGKWPGNETDEQIREALERLS